MRLYEEQIRIPLPIQSDRLLSHIADPSQREPSRRCDAVALRRNANLQGPH